MKARLTSILLLVCIFISAFSLFSCVNAQEPVVILYENDVHCAVDGYSKLAAMKKELSSVYKHVGIVSSGDFIQGAAFGAVSKGEYIVNLMNKVGYDAIALGNHEFDFLLPRLLELNEMSNTKFVSCNFEKIENGEPIFEPYRIVAYGKVKVAYIGVTTPETYRSSSPSQFKDENGELKYTFGEDKLCETVQKNVDEVREQKVDYVIALSHVGDNEGDRVFGVFDLISGVEGIDVVLDAHSHSVIEGTTLKDKGGEDVLLTSTGTQFEHIGKLTLEKDKITSELIKTEEYEKTDATLDSYLEKINESYASIGNRYIGRSEFDLITHDENGNRIIRNQETNLGNFCSDAFRTIGNADIAYLSGGGLRAPIKAGDVTFNDIYTLLPFGNWLVVLEVTGQEILDMLEMGVYSYPDESSFPHMSGLKFSINTAIPSSVKLDSTEFFEKVDGEYRVYNVEVLDKESGEYKPLDLEKTYTLAGHNHTLLDLGGGMSMLEGAKVVVDDGILDVEVIEAYITKHLGGVIGEEYAKAQGRITFTDGFSE